QNAYFGSASTDIKNVFETIVQTKELTSRIQNQAEVLVKQGFRPYNKIDAYKMAAQEVQKATSIKVLGYAKSVEEIAYKRGVIEYLENTIKRLQ
ncbi:hypothetical protein ACKI1Q_43910, partial [Streptomyces galilaeus]|uniref:hypothetical protein n=1 Tax=Streptomyces galilaeus TaxID=33899 RepID=UPI0038F77848